jgi:hypothetical protein
MNVAGLDPRSMAQRLLEEPMSGLLDRMLHDLLARLRQEVSRRDLHTLVTALRTYLSQASPDPDVRDLIADNGPAEQVLFSTEEWETGHLLAAHADVTFANGQTEFVDLRPLQAHIIQASATHRAMGYAAEYQVDLGAGAGEFAAVGFDNEQAHQRDKEADQERAV